MNEKFFDLKKEKQDRMINAALHQFALCGYKLASTDEIVKEAGISKGLLFHYFISKEGLYDFLYGYSLKYVAMEMNATADPEEKDFFNIRERMEEGRINVMKNFPQMPLFLMQTKSETDKTACSIIEESGNTYADICKTYYARASMGGIRIPADHLIFMADSTIDCLLQKHMQSGTFSLAAYQEEFMGFLRDLRLMASV